VTADFNHHHFQRVRWSIYAILVAAYISVFFHRMAPAVVSAELMASFHTSATALGSLAAMYYYIYTAMQLPAGVLADTLGNRVTVTLGNIVAGIGSILFGLSESLGAASVGRFLVGLGVSVIFVGLMKSNTVWFRERIYGVVSGMTLLIGNLGSVLAAGPLAYLLQFWSWREIFVVIGLFSLLLALLSALFVRNRPEEAGFPSLREMAGESAHAAREKHWLQDLGDVWRNRLIWPGFWLNFGMAGGLFAFAGLWAIPLLRDLHGLTTGEASSYTTVTLFSMAVSTFALGWLSDTLGRRKAVAIISAALYLAAWLLLLFLPWQPGPLALLLFALLGLTGGGFVLTYACAKEVAPPALSGMAISVVNTGLFLGAAIMQPLFGWVLDRSWSGEVVAGVNVYSASSYHDALLLMAGFALIALVGALRLRETGARNITLLQDTQQGRR
jgi:sugar phosphate permease